MTVAASPHAPFRLTRLLHALVHDPLRISRLRSNDRGAFEGLDADREHLEAILDRNFPVLYSWGAHPIALFHLSAVLQPRPYYVREVVPKLQGMRNHFDDYYRLREGDGAEA